MDDGVLKLLQQVKTFDIAQTGKVLHHYFESNKSAEGVVVTKANKPAGIIMRSYYYQKIGNQYGISLYMNRPVEILMNHEMLIMDAGCDLANIGFLAMARKEEDIYNFVLIVRENELLGIISIKNFLIEMSKAKEHEIELLRQQGEILKKSHEKEKEHSLYIEQTNVDLNKKNLAIKNLMDNAGQGFFTIDRNLIVADEFSNECIKIFGLPIGGKNIVNLFTLHMGAETGEIYKDILNNVFKEENEFKNKVYLSLLPVETKINNKIITLEYRMINDYDKMIMFVITDITEKKELEIQMAEEKENLKLIVKAVTNKTDFQSNIEEISHFFKTGAHEAISQAADKKLMISELYRSIHTFKGNFAQLSLNNAAEKLHELESGLSEILKNMDEHCIEKVSKLIKSTSGEKILKKDISVITNVLGRDYFKKDEILQVNKKLILNTEKSVIQLCSAEQQSKLLPIIRLMRYSNLKSLIYQYNDYLHYLCTRLEKYVDDMIISGDEILIDRNPYDGFLKSLVHIFRNIADHGIETPEERMESGKNESGIVFVRLEDLSDQQFLMIITDDGHGVDIQKVKEKAVREALITPAQSEEMNESDIYQFLFADNFSTKETATMISGRGVGLSAVKSEVEKLGGHIDVHSVYGHGTEFKIWLNK
jgi:two-component system chemotaxis sensor kinase CheA